MIKRIYLSEMCYIYAKKYIFCIKKLCPEQRSERILNILFYNAYYFCRDHENSISNVDRYYFYRDMDIKPIFYGAAQNYQAYRQISIDLDEDTFKNISADEKEFYNAHEKPGIFFDVPLLTYFLNKPSYWNDYNNVIIADAYRVITSIEGKIPSKIYEKIQTINRLYDFNNKYIYDKELKFLESIRSYLQD